MSRKDARRSAPAKRRKGTAPVQKLDQNYVDQARSLVMESWPEIIQGLISKSREGGYQHAKLLIDICGMLKERSHDGETKDEQQLCDVLLKSLQIYMTRGTEINENERVKSKNNQQISQDGYEKHTDK